MMDVATALRKQREEVHTQLNIEDTKADLSRRLQATAQVTGETLGEEEISAAIDSYFSDLYAFKDPKRNFQYHLATLYVDRTRLGKRYGIPLLAFLLITGTIWGTYELYSAHQIAQLEKRVEHSVEDTYRRKRSLESQIALLEEQATRLGDLASLPVATDLREASTHLQESESFFSSYAPTGDAENFVTADNFQSVERALPSVLKSLKKADNLAQGVKAEIQREKRLREIEKSLKTQITGIRKINSTSPFLDKAEQVYRSGVSSIRSRQLDEALQYDRQLRETTTDIELFAVLPAQAENLYQQAMEVVEESIAREEVDAVYTNVVRDTKALNMRALKGEVEELKRLVSNLKTELAITIVDRRGVKSGIDRYYTDKRGRRSSGYYLIVEARDSRGQIVPQRIRNEETGKTSVVKLWGERVSHAVYERVKRDKLADGRVDHNLFAKKPVGHLQRKIIMTDPRGAPIRSAGQITRW